MAHPSGRPDTPVTESLSLRRSPKKHSVLESLLENPKGFSFSQALRLLARAHGPEGPENLKRFLKDQIRIRPYLSLGFPPTDLTSIETLPAEEGREEEAARFRMTATFLGLYGPSSPLPTFYTEELLEEQNEDKSVSRDFLDILNQGFFVLFALADTQYSLIRRICEETSEDLMQRLYSLVGMGHPEMREKPFHNPGSLLRVMGLLTQFPRSAAGLRGLLADRMGVPVTIRSCEPRMATFPEDQRACLGIRASHLGEDCRIGSVVEDAMGKIAVEAGPMDADTYARFLPGEREHHELFTLVRFYCTQPLECDLEFLLKPETLHCGILGQPLGCRLGCDFWLAPQPGLPVRAKFSDSHAFRKTPSQRSTGP